MVGYYYKTGAEIHEIICFMEEKLKLSCVTSPSSLKTGQTYGWKPYRFSFFLNAQNKFVYLIEPLANDETDYEQLAKRCQSKEEKEMTKEEALKKIEELKAFVEKLDEEIPEMITSTNSKETAFLGSYEHGALNEYYRITFNDETDKRYYLIKAFELAHLMYAREHLRFETVYFCKYRLYYNLLELQYNVIEFDRHNDYASNGVFKSINHWLFPDEDSARKVANYMNKYVADKVKELY